jgi:hypothetical protein
MIERSVSGWSKSAMRFSNSAFELVEHFVVAPGETTPCRVDECGFAVSIRRDLPPRTRAIRFAFLRKRIPSVSECRHEFRRTAADATSDRSGEPQIATRRVRRRLARLRPLQRDGRCK